MDSLRAAGFQGALQPEAPLAPLTTWKIGGPAEILATPRDRADLQRALKWAVQEEIPWRVLGNGSNLLVCDQGVQGLVLYLRKVLAGARCHGHRITAGAGEPFPAVARLAARSGLAGLEFAAGIPGTVGGAIVMNAGWHRYETGRLVESVEVCREDGVLLRLPGRACMFGYRTSRFQNERCIVLAATMRLQPAEPGPILARMEQFVESRKRSQPTDLPSCGSVYLKPEGDFAGRLIEAAGMKGRRAGAVQVSPLHANFFVNLGGGTAAQALALMEQVEEGVFRKFGVHLTREVKIWS